MLVEIFIASDQDWNLPAQSRAIEPRVPLVSVSFELVTLRVAVLGINKFREPKLSCRFRLWLAMYMRFFASFLDRPGGYLSLIHI